MSEDLFALGQKAGRIEALVKLRAILERAIEYQKEDFGVMNRIKYKTKGLNVSRPLLPGFKEAVKQIEKLVKAFNNENPRKDRTQG